MNITIKGKVVTPSDISEGAVLIENGKIAEISPSVSKAEKEYDFGQAFILPGFIDIHLHGLGDYNTEDKAGIVGMAGLEPTYGTTSFLPTAAMMTVEQYITAGQDAREAGKETKGNGAKIAGIHLEGPFINPKSSGAMPLSTRRPISLSEIKNYVEQIGDFLKIMTLSPELEGSLEAIRFLASNNVVVSLGHSIADPKQLSSFIEAGLSHVCHLFNTFELADFREPGSWKPGLVEHILASDCLTCEVICDMCHVEPEYIRIAAKALGPDRFVAITDSLQGTGLPENTYHLPGNKEYRITKEAARSTSNNGLAGSILTMNKAFENLVECCGLEIVLAAKFTSTNASKVIGISNETGSIEIGKLADIAVLDKDYNCIATFVNGTMIYGN
ncbi:MAG: N-acetylglucosamine-6-phosphate deacetylase [Planctomycetota bacterium]|jgi:N-acetylglucosamine-6-phosphate deacetylase